MPLQDSESFNIQFLQAVETFRCLYDLNWQEQSSKAKEEQDDAWNLIAQQFSSTAMECRLRWKYLRGGLTRYNKKRKQREASGVVNKRLKRFYLWDFMQFVLPFLKPKDGDESFPASCLDNNDDKSGDIIKGEFSALHQDNGDTDNSLSCRGVPMTLCQIDLDDSDPSLRQLGRVREPPSPIRAKKERKSFMTTTTTRDHDYSFERPVAEKSAKKPENPDMGFFKSILPDVSELNASQKRRFKVKVLQLLDDMLNSDQA